MTNVNWFGKSASVAIFVGNGFGNTVSTNTGISVGWILESRAGTGGRGFEQPVPGLLTNAAGIIECGLVGKLY